MSKLNYISKGLRKALALPFKLVGNTFIALGFTLSLGINGILFPEDLSKMEALLSIFKDLKTEIEGGGIIITNNVEEKK